MTAAALQDRRGVTVGILLSVGAIVASAAHVVIDFVAGIYPPNLIGVVFVGVPAVALYVVWISALARLGRGDGGARTAARLLALWQAALANGAAALIPCPPTVLLGGTPSCDLAPWQDVAHLASLLLGVAAFVVLRRVGAAHTADTALTRLAVVVLVVHLALATAVALL